MSAMLQEVLAIQGERAPLEKEEAMLRDHMQALHAFRALVGNSLIREGIEWLLESYQLRLNDIEWEKRHPKTHEVATNANDPGYWQEKGRELRAEGEGLTQPWCRDDENLGDA